MRLRLTPRRSSISELQPAPPDLKSGPPDLKSAPIGMFDSGFGGLTVARAVMDLMPNEQLIYLGDTARYPYGPRELGEVAEFAHQIAEELIVERGVKVLIVACNTAAAAALDSLSEQYDIPIMGVIEPGVASLLKATNTGHVGVIGTVGTIGSGAYQRAVSANAANAGHTAPELTALACPGFVEFVERGVFDTEQVRVLAERLLAPALDAKVDTLLLGCTHYPYLARTISDVMGHDVVLVSSADETAFALRDVLVESGLAAPEAPADESRKPTGTPPARFVTTGDVNSFEELGRKLLGPELERAEQLIWPASP